MPPTQQASKVNDHMMFTPHQNPFIDLLLTTITVIHAIFKKRQQEVFYLFGRGWGVTVGELCLFFRILFHQAAKRDLKHINSKDYNNLKAFIMYPGLYILSISMTTWRKFCTGKFWLKGSKMSLQKCKWEMKVTASWSPGKAFIPTTFKWHLGIPGE